ncbi:C-terminal binding protein [Streptomyces sp. NBC_01314]|uniref:C-terminal binding protein n=1 Tax=Streptomyces sp. NBC_01314 TaxID=2903821 RepID=UPI00308F0E10|nr:C-terminal binding protein [Streptomyces sp. NBC_01314]
MLIVLADTVFPDSAIERNVLAEAGHELVIADSPDQAVELLPEADGVLTAFLDLSAERIHTMKRAKIIARYGIGVDNVDVAAAHSQGITVTNVPDYCIEEVATHTVAMLLSLLRKLPEADRHVRAGGWGVAGVRPLRRVSELTIGLIGFGRIGRLVAETLAPLGPTLLASDPYARSVPDRVRLVEQSELLAASDAVLLHAPLTPGTAGLIGTETLLTMKPGALLVNASRGGLVDLTAVTDALRDGRLGGAALDVFPTEPVDLPSISDIPNLHVSSHIAYYSEEALRESQHKAATQIVRVLAGEAPDYPVVPPKESE